MGKVFEKSESLLLNEVTNENTCALPQQATAAMHALDVGDATAVAMKMAVQLPVVVHPYR